MHVEPHHTARHLAHLIRAEPSGRVARCSPAARLAVLGHTAADAAGRVLLSERQVRT